MNKGILFALLAFLLLGVGGGGFFLLSGDEGGDSLANTSEEIGEDSKDASDAEAEGQIEGSKRNKTRKDSSRISKKESSSDEALAGNGHTSTKTNPDGTIKGAANGSNEGDVSVDVNEKGGAKASTTPVKVAKSVHEMAIDRRRTMATTPMLEPAKAKEGEYATYVKPASFGAGALDEKGNAIQGSRVVRTRTGAPNASTGRTNIRSHGALEPFSRLVKGYVFEFKEGAKVPLSGVVVSDLGDRNRVFTNDAGFFEFNAYFSDEGKRLTDPRDDDPSNDKVYVLARADGYRMLSQHDYQTRSLGRMNFVGINFFDDELSDDAGLQIELKWHGSDVVKTRLVNPPSDPTKIMMRVEAYNDANKARANDNFLLEAFADEKGEAEFTFPPRRWITITASGDGYETSVNGVWNRDEKVWEITLLSAENMWVEGRILDARSGASLSGVRVFSSSMTRSSVYSDADGSFGGWMTPTKQGENFNLYVVFELAGYWMIRENFYKVVAGPVKLDAGGQVPVGPWTIRLRPLVSVDFEISLSTGEAMEEGSALIAVDGTNSLNWPVYEAQNANGVLKSDRFPWGLKSAKFMHHSLDDAGRRRRMVFETGFGEGFWTEANEYSGTIIAQRR